MIFKIGFVNKRKDAKRHLWESFKAESIQEAKQHFNDVKEKANKRYELRLYTGDWKEVE